MFHCFSADHTKLSLVPCVRARKSRNTIDSWKSRFPKNGDFLISSPRILVIYGKCFSLVAMFWRAHSHVRNTNFCLLYLKSNLLKGETWKASFFARWVSFPQFSHCYLLSHLYMNLISCFKPTKSAKSANPGRKFGMDVCMYLFCIYWAASITFAKNIEPAACAIDLKHGD